jgi:hypothetical protein
MVFFTKILFINTYFIIDFTVYLSTYPAELETIILASINIILFYPTLFYSILFYSILVCYYFIFIFLFFLILYTQSIFLPNFTEIEISWFGHTQQQ